MARKPRFTQRTWQFSDGGNKFDGRQRRRTRHSSQKPISPALKRGVIRCKRCNSRVVGNVDNCPYCGKSLRPFFLRFWFWLAVVIVAAATVVYLLMFRVPQGEPRPTSPTNQDRVQIVGSPENSSFKNLTLGSAIDDSGLEVVVTSVSPGPEATNGAQIFVVDIEFINKTDAIETLYSTQWMLESSDGTRVDTFVGSAIDGVTIASNFDSYELVAGGSFSGRLYFALTQSESEDGSETEVIIPNYIVYQPSPLAYDEESLVTWLINAEDIA